MQRRHISDHSRTTLPRAGEWFRNSRDLFGLFLLAAGVVLMVVCLNAAATGLLVSATWTGIAAALALSGGAVWLFVEGRRIHRIDAQWHDDHPERDHTARSPKIDDGRMQASGFPIEQF